MPRKPRAKHHVYVVELDDRVWNHGRFRRANPDYQLGKPFVYVGMTGLDPDIHKLLRTPRRVLEVAVPVRMDDGRVEVFTGWRIHHDTTRGPAKEAEDLDIPAFLRRNR